MSVSSGTCAPTASCAQDGCFCQLYCCLPEVVLLLVTLASLSAAFLTPSPTFWLASLMLLLTELLMPEMMAAAARLASVPWCLSVWSTGAELLCLAVGDVDFEMVLLLWWMPLVVLCLVVLLAWPVLLCFMPLCMVLLVACLGVVDVVEFLLMADAELDAASSSTAARSTALCMVLASVVAVAGRCSDDGVARRWYG